MEDYIKIRVDKKFKELLKKESKKVGLSVSAFIRLKLTSLIENDNA